VAGGGGWPAPVDPTAHKPGFPGAGIGAGTPPLGPCPMGPAPVPDPDDDAVHAAAVVHAAPRDAHRRSPPADAADATDAADAPRRRLSVPEGSGVIAIDEFFPR